jgi:hypothetical protein
MEDGPTPGSRWRGVAPASLLRHDEDAQIMDLHLMSGRTLQFKDVVVGLGGRRRMGP